MAFPEGTDNPILQKRILRASSFLESVDPDTPLELQVKNFTKQHPEMGSKDRKVFQDLVYGTLRLRHALADLSWQEACTVAFSIWNSEDPQKSWESSVWASNPLFPHSLSPELDGLDWKAGFFAPRKVFVRQMQPGKFGFAAWLEKEGVLENVEGKTLTLKKSKAMENAPGWAPGRFEVMDLAVQSWAEELPKLENGQTVLDACCASGGKSLLLLEANPNIDLTATDVRENILRSYRGRLGNHSKNIEILTKNWEEENPLPSKFDFILADVPCSGSGTWLRSPQHLSNFTVEKLNEHAERQKRIVTNLSKHLEKNGKLMYVTCSIFEEENEKIVEFMQNSLGLSLIFQNYSWKWKEGGDSIFFALME